MKITNTDPPASKALRATRGSTSTNLAGAKGMLWRDASTESAGQIRDMTVIGATFTDNEDGTGILTIGGSAGTGTPPWVNVTNFGAVGDGTTDDTAAINAAIADLNALGAGVLYFPASTAAYRVTAALTTISVPARVMGDGRWSNDGPISKIEFEHATASLFTFSADGCEIDHLGIENTSAGATAGAALTVTGGTLFQAHDLTVYSFWQALDIENSNVWSMRDCYLGALLKYGVRVRNTASPDSGDWTIHNTTISGVNGVANNAGVRIESSGGGRITSSKITGPAGGATSFVYGIDIAIGASVDTVILIVEGCSVENLSGDMIHGTIASGSTYGSIIISGNEFGMYGPTTGKAINLVATDAGGFYNVTIGQNAYDSTTATTAIQLTNCDRVSVLGGPLHGAFTTLLSTTTCTNVIEATGGIAGRVAVTGTPSSGQVPTATSGTTAVWSTPSASSATGGILLASDHATPFTFDDILQTSDGTDFLYASE